MSTDTPKTSGQWRKKHTSLSWSTAGKDSIHTLVASITDSGNAVMFSRTMDGSALVLSIYAGSERVKEYVVEPGDIVPLFAWAVETYA